MKVPEKVVAVVGGASGMAKATAEQLAERGARIAIVDRPGSDGAAVAGALGAGATFHELDVTDFDATGATLDAVVAEHGALHVVVNTAGGGAIARTLGREGPHPLDEFQRTIDLNLVATFNVSRLAAQLMSRNDPEDGERGVIINTASIAAFEGQIGQVAYAAAKAGIAGMTLTMARDLGSLGIRVLAIAPSLFLTGISQGISDDMAAQLTRDAAFPKRMGRPSEYGQLAVSLVENQMLNGSTIRLDGGQRFAPK